MVVFQFTLIVLVFVYILLEFS